ncbi:Protein of unknown function [Marinobacter sp. LV10R510-11A]|uniref:DUF3732 domain-containing protein n=1 Tax=Marinobacter sp. LV10R510-11A TaxID=1415568 RepID=UPI000BB95DA0|nr:DUF3732 domain-containing protein [Marinobacter sp. LV10R510-11A]SOB76836.1 Protein of unknown function [Marinobacter sp. LV10R510-11A]
MTWRIKSLVLYQRGGADRRKLSFNLHGVNVITGNSQTGKSAVLDILNYILMSKSCPIPKGIIRQAVSHVGGHLVGPDGELLIIRPLPAPGAKVSTQGWYQLGKDLVFPNELPEMISNRAQIRDILSSFTGIAGAAVLSNSREPWEEVLAEANIRHAAPLIFQPQDVIANRHVSVPGLDRDEHRRHMLDALPFLLGIEDAEILEARVHLRKLKSNLAALRMKRKERGRLRANTFARGHKLWLETQGIGLLGGESPQSVPELLGILRDVQVDENKRFDVATAIPNIRQLEANELQSRNAVQEARKHVRSLRDFERNAGVHQDVISRQLNKLSISELLPTQTNKGGCPICESEAFHPERQRDQLMKTLSSLTGIRAVPLRVDAKARKARVRLEEELVPLEEQHEAARSRLREAITTISKNAEYFTADREIDRLLGRISEYIRTVDIGEMDDDEENLASLEDEINVLERKINSIAMRRKKTQESINRTMTGLARWMEVEFKKGNASISVEDLSIKVQIDPDSDEMTSLAEIGSGANWVCYHLAGILAIHDHLSRNACPVPRTLLIDQPSQAWFPEELRTTNREGELVPEDEEDTNRVRDIYRLLDEMTTKEGFSQIIVMDHAKFGDDWFEKMVRYEWRHGQKLVPEHWISEPAKTP